MKADLLGILKQALKLPEQTAAASPSASATITSTPSLVIPPDPPDIRQLELESSGKGVRETDKTPLLPNGLSARLTKIGFPIFNGTSLDNWVYKCEQFFSVDNTLPELKVRLASVHLEDKARQWHKNYMRNRFEIYPSWTQYVMDLSVRFGKLVDDPLFELVSLKQSGESVEVYLDKFEAALARLSLLEPHALNIFLSNMNPHLASHVRRFDVTTVAYAVWIAKHCESSLLQHSSATQNRAPFNPYQNCNDQPYYEREFGKGPEIEFDRESDEIKDEKLQDKQPEEDVKTLIMSSLLNVLVMSPLMMRNQVPFSSMEPSPRYLKESLVVVNDLSYDLGCVIIKTNGCICDSELGQANSHDEKKFKGLNLGKLLRDEWLLSIVCLLGLHDMSCWTQLLRQQIFPKSWRFKFKTKSSGEAILLNTYWAVCLGCCCYEYKNQMLLLGYHGLEVQVLSCLQEFGEGSKTDICIVLCWEKLASFLWFLHGKKLLDTCQKMQSMLVSGFKTWVPHVGYELRLAGTDHVLVMGVKQLTLAAMKFHLKHKWRSRLLRLFSEVEVDMDNITSTIQMKDNYWEIRQSSIQNDVDEAVGCVRHIVKVFSTESQFNFQRSHEHHIYVTMLKQWVLQVVFQQRKQGIEKMWVLNEPMIGTGFSLMTNIESPKEHEQLEDAAKGIRSYESNIGHVEKSLTEFSVYGVFHLQRPPELG